MVEITGVSVFYALNLIYFYLYLLPSIGGKFSAKCSEIPYCSRHLKLTWLDYSTDTSDGQWREFRGSLWLLWICILINVIVNFSIRRLCKQYTVTSRGRQLSLNLHLLSRLIFGLIFLVVQHGYHSTIVMSIALIGYCVAKLFKGSKLSIFASWTYAGAIILFKESYRIRYYPHFQFLQPLFARNYGGMYGWQLPANFLILRLISFSVDYGEACAHHNDIKSAKFVAEIGMRNTCDEHFADHAQRNEIESEKLICPFSFPATHPEHRNKSKGSDDLHLDIEDFKFLNFVVYVLYAPLYMAGPIITYSDFVRSSKKESRGDSFPWMYCLRWLLCLALMEFMVFIFPLFAIINSNLFFQLSVAEMGAAAYIALKLMWLKFLLLWRFFRLWALADGIAAPENMLRCMSNNYSLEQFWKGWHASFNKWIVTYLYLPLGGRKNRTMSVWAVFFFVAVWHDIELKLLVWGTLNSVFYVIEVLAKSCMRSELAGRLPPMLRHLLCSVSGALYIIVLIAVNLIGYAVGVDGISSIYAKLVTWDGLKVLLVSLYFLSVGTSLMMDLEGRRGGDKRDYSSPVLSGSAADVSKERTE